jgi:3',5'-cyclic AMP phosphodiesterase CpdA
MRVFAVSDVHLDYDVNAKWIENLSGAEYQEDVLILAGDVSNTLRLLDCCLTILAKRFKKVLFVPGNHELWVLGEGQQRNSLQKLNDVFAVVESCGASVQAFCEHGLLVIPLLGWYDYSFGEPSKELKSMWLTIKPAAPCQSHNQNRRSNLHQ